STQHDSPGKLLQRCPGIHRGNTFHMSATYRQKPGLPEGNFRVLCSASQSGAGTHGVHFPADSAKTHRNIVYPYVLYANN
ncbi:MAG: hypothetical protein OEU91_11310, partial [Gammaproteobacteria bacterium]|nr:hypothetical protein [Gammaproteobacteria bacterium]